jgi:hypothetical protein
MPVGVGVAPQIPFINDDMEQVLEPQRRPAPAAPSTP